MSLIRKFVLENKNLQKLRLPCNSKIMSVIEQSNKIVLYVMISNNCSDRDLLIHVIGYEQIFSSLDKKFIGTVSLGGGTQIVHIFYEWDVLSTDQ